MSSRAHSTPQREGRRIQDRIRPTVPPCEEPSVTLRQFDGSRRHSSQRTRFHPGGGLRPQKFSDLASSKGSHKAPGHSKSMQVAYARTPTYCNVNSVTCIFCRRSWSRYHRRAKGSLSECDRVDQERNRKERVQSE